MKNRKGFTLIELMITIAIIATISVVVGVNIMQTLNSQKRKDDEQFAKTLEDAACTYADVVGIDSEYNISTCNLIKDGYLKKKTIPGTEYVLGEDKNLTIRVYWTEDNEKVCEYDENQTPNDNLTCEDIGRTIYRQSYTRVANYGSSAAAYYPYKITSLSLRDYSSRPNSMWESYLKHEIDIDKRIINSYVCFKDNGTEYCLQGGDGGSAFSTNHNLLMNNTFSSISCNDYGDEVACSGDYFYVYIYPSGTVGVTGGGDCYINEDSTSKCGLD